MRALELRTPRHHALGMRSLWIRLGLALLCGVVAAPAGAEIVYRLRGRGGQRHLLADRARRVPFGVIELRPDLPSESPDAPRERIERQLEVADELEQSRRQREADQAEQRATPPPPPPPAQVDDRPHYIIPFYPPHWGRPPVHRPPPGHPPHEPPPVRPPPVFPPPPRPLPPFRPPP